MKKMMKRVIKQAWRQTVSTALTAGLVLTVATLGFAAEKSTSAFSLHITGFGSDQGKAMVAIADSEENFDSDEKPFVGLILPIQNQEVNQTVTLPYGEYAVKVFHDSNENGQLDTLIFGIPKEKYGFSNNARGTMGPPPYEKARFTLASPKRSMAITVQ